MSADPRGSDRFGGLKRSVVDYYEARLARFGPTPRGMDWKDRDSQWLRFRVLSEVCDLAGKTVHEIGAGAGHFHDFLAERAIAAHYSGSDLSEAMVAEARRLHPGVPFQRLDLLTEALDTRYDVVLCSGVLHVRLDHSDEEWREFVWATIRRMFEACQIAIAFNLMSDDVDFRAPGLFYANPGEVFERCRRELSCHVVLRHDYPLYEFTTYVYPEPLP